MRLPRRFPRRARRRVAISIALGIAAFVLVSGQEDEIDRLRAAAGQPVPVVLAAQTLVRGTVLTEGDLTVAEFPTSFAPPGAASTVEEVIGRALMTDLRAGEAVTATRVGTEAGPIAAQVPQGLRAFTIEVPIPPDTLRPGDRVDVLGSYGGPRPWSDTVASGLEVLAVLEPEAGAMGEEPSLVLLVSTTTAERLAYATAFGELSIAIVAAPS